MNSLRQVATPLPRMASDIHPGRAKGDALPNNDRALRVEHDTRSIRDVGGFRRVNF